MLNAIALPFVWLRDFLLAAVALALACPLWLLPWGPARRLGRIYGLTLGALSPGARRVGMINLWRAYGSGLGEAGAQQAVAECFGSLGQGVAEGVQFSRRFKNGQPGWQDLFEAEDPDLERRILEDPRPKLFVTGHFGSWEVAVGIAGLRMGERGAVIIRRIDNIFLNAIVRRVRLRRASQWIEKKGAAALALARLRRGESVAMLLDENAGPRGTFVDFFGRPVSTGKIAALLSIATGAPIVVGACVRRPGRRFLHRLAVVDPLASDRESSVAAITQEIVATLERWVRDDPWQWRWMHWRWKTRPDGTEESYGRRELAGCFEETRASTAGGGQRTVASR